MVDTNLQSKNGHQRKIVQIYMFWLNGFKHGFRMWNEDGQISNKLLNSLSVPFVSRHASVSSTYPCQSAGPSVRPLVIFLKLLSGTQSPMMTKVVAVNCQSQQTTMLLGCMEARMLVQCL